MIIDLKLKQFNGLLVQFLKSNDLFIEGFILELLNDQDNTRVVYKDFICQNMLKYCLVKFKICKE